MLPSGSFTVYGDFAWATVAMRARVGRDWVRKAFGAYFTVLIEIGWGKQRIMEVYLNVVGQAQVEHDRGARGGALSG
jgi:hypothetical protein